MKTRGYILIIFLILILTVSFFIFRKQPQKEDLNLVQEDKTFLLGTKKYNFTIAEPNKDLQKIIKFDDLMFDVLAERYQMSFYKKKIIEANVCLQKSETNSNILGSMKTTGLFTNEGYQFKEVSKIDCNGNSCEYRWYYYFADRGQCYIFESHLKFEKSVDPEFNFSNVESEKITDLKTKKIINYIDKVQEDFILNLKLYNFSDF